MKYEVSELFIKEAYDAACDNWKRRLEKEFPEIFSIYSKLQRFNEYSEFLSDSYGKDSVIVLGKYILIELPQDNSKWTKSAFLLSIKIHDEGIARFIHAKYREDFMRFNTVSFRNGEINKRDIVDFILMERV